MRAHCDETGRVLCWTRLDDDPTFFETEFSNGDEMDGPEYNHYDPDDWVIVDGVARPDPKPATEIVDLKKNLKDTDYISAKIAEGAATREEYADMIALRQSWRDRINELRGVI